MPSETPGPESIRCADCGQPLAACACAASESVPYRGVILEVGAQDTGDGWWAPVLTIHWTHPQTGPAQRTEMPNIPPELFRSAGEAQERAMFHGRNWVNRRPGVTWLS